MISDSGKDQKMLVSVPFGSNGKARAKQNRIWPKCVDWNVFVSYIIPQQTTDASSWVSYWKMSVFDYCILNTVLHGMCFAVRFVQYIQSTYSSCSGSHVYTYGINLILYTDLSGVPRWLSGKESACNTGYTSSIPESGRFPRREKWQPTPVFLPGNFMAWRAWRATVRGVIKSQARLSN